MKLRVVFTGDISFSERFSGSWNRDDLLSPRIRSYLNEADDVIGNVESPLTSNRKQNNKKLSHSSDPRAGRFLRESNIKVWNLANNHIKDCGEKGIIDTLDAGKANDCKIIGVGKTPESAATPIII